jgi:hypothetical protein
MTLIDGLRTERPMIAPRWRRPVQWIEEGLVAEVRYLERTPTGLLRHTSAWSVHPELWDSRLRWSASRPGRSHRVRSTMAACFGLLAAGPMFFVSAWVLMIFAGIVHDDVGIRPFGYGTAFMSIHDGWRGFAGRWNNAQSRSVAF